MRHKKGEAMPWSKWEDLGGILASAPCVSSWESKRLDIFAKGNDGALWHLWFNKEWKQWESLGRPMTGPLIEAPAAVSWGDDRIDVFARLADNRMHHRWWNGDNWSTWEDLGGQLGSVPTVSSWGKRRLDIF